MALPSNQLDIERERNEYASRALALVVLLNGISAMVLLALVAQNPSKKSVADAMMVFCVGAMLGLTSAFIAYLNRTIRFEWPKFTIWRRPLRWLAVVAAILGTACFFVGMNVARNSIEDASSSTIRSTTRAKSKSPLPSQEQPIAPQPAEPQTTEPPASQTEPEPPITESPHEPLDPQATEPPITEPRPGEPQQTEI